MSLTFIFPGQGSQAVGMGQELSESFASARAVFQEVDDALGQSLSAIMLNGPADDLTLTANTQPALMACSIAVMRVLEKEFDVPVTVASHVAGHSLGEYSALCAAGSLELAQTAKLLKLRGEAMQQAVPVGQGAMAALLGATNETAQALCDAVEGLAEIANDNATGQVVISGETAAITQAIELASDHGIKRAVLLPVSAPFHCSLMQPAANAMAAALADTEIKAPVVPVINNVTARPTSDVEQIRADLITQVTGRVRWRESVIWMAENGITSVAEPGTGKVLSGMMRRIAKEVSATALNTPADLENFAEIIKG
jgi:[acyl-carrier-protein] S-malonyltransferase